MIQQQRIFNISSNPAGTISNNNGSKKSNVSFQIDNFVQKTAEISHMYLSIIHAELPNSFYVINETNNRLSVLYQGSTINIYIPPGQYTCFSLMDLLPLYFPPSFTFAYSDIYGKYTITNSADPFTILANSTISVIMGLDSINNMVSVTEGDFQVLTLPYIINFFPCPRINIRSNQLQATNYNAPDKTSDLIVSIQNNANQAGIVLYDNVQMTNKILIRTNYINQFTIRITDDLNNELDFHNSDWYITLAVEIHYSSPQKWLTFEDSVDQNNKRVFSEMNDENEVNDA